MDGAPLASPSGPPLPELLGLPPVPVHKVSFPSPLTATVLKNQSPGGTPREELVSSMVADGDLGPNIRREKFTFHGASPDSTPGPDHEV